MYIHCDQCQREYPINKLKRASNGRYLCKACAYPTAICTMCGKEKKRAEFSPNDSTNGLMSWCKPCRAEYTRLKRNKNKDMIRLCVYCQEQKPLSDFAGTGKDIPCKTCAEVEQDYRKRTGLDSVGNRPRWQPTPLYNATPRKPFKRWTAQEKARYYRVLLTPPDERE